VGSGDIAPRILNLGTRWRWVVSFTPRPLYLRGKSPWYPLHRRPSGPQSRRAVQRRKNFIMNFSFPSCMVHVPESLLCWVYQSRASYVCSFVHLPVISSLSGPNILLRTMFSKTPISNLLWVVRRHVCGWVWNSKMTSNVENSLILIVTFSFRICRRYTTTDSPAFCHILIFPNTSTNF